VQWRLQCDFTYGGNAEWQVECTTRAWEESMLRNAILLVLFFVLLFAWILGWAAFHIAGGAIHLLLVLAVIVLVAHFLRGRRAV